MYKSLREEKMCWNNIFFWTMYIVWISNKENASAADCASVFEQTSIENGGHVRSSLCAWRRKQSRLPKRPVCLKFGRWTESKNGDSFSKSYSIVKACSVEKKCLFLPRCVCILWVGVWGEIIGSKGAKFEVASFNIIVNMWQNGLRYCQDGTEHVTLLSGWDRTR